MKQSVIAFLCGLIGVLVGIWIGKAQVRPMVFTPAPEPTIPRYVDSLRIGHLEIGTKQDKSRITMDAQSEVPFELLRLNGKRGLMLFSGNDMTALTLFDRKGEPSSEWASEHDDMSQSIQFNREQFSESH